ncbi:MAG: hypothetical protein GF350_09055 [Chitinivibrionales bacterium]|nr:hypothetical protein [Chitinivibrionales bacterium]
MRCAYDYGGKLCILGTFDTIETAKLPVLRASCAYAFQIRWVKGESGIHEVKVQFVTEDGETTLDEMVSNLKLSVSSGKNIILTNHVINFQQLKFNNYGNYYAILIADERKIGHVQVHIKRKKGA